MNKEDVQELYGRGKRTLSDLFEDMKAAVEQAQAWDPKADPKDQLNREMRGRFRLVLSCDTHEHSMREARTGTTVFRKTAKRFTSEQITALKSVADALRETISHVQELGSSPEWFTVEINVPYTGLVQAIKSGRCVDAANARAVDEIRGLLGGFGGWDVAALPSNPQ